MYKSKKKKDENPTSPSKMALSSDYDNASGGQAEESKSMGSTSSSRKSSSKKKKSDEVSIKMPSTSSRSRKSTSRFSLRGWLLNNPIFPPPFGQSSTSSSSPRSKAKSKDQQDQFDNRSLWRDNVSSCSSGQAGAGAGGSNGVRECPLCMAECTLDQFPLLRNCSHLFCMDCLHTYTKLEIQEGRVSLKCPQCTELIHPNDIALLLGEKYGHLVTLYESLMLRRVLATDPDTRWCPRPNCTFAVIAAGCASCPKIECEHPGCGNAFCYHCKAEWHPNQTCDAARAQRNQNFRSASATFSLDSSNAPNASGSAAAPAGSAPSIGSGVAAAGTLNYSEVKACPRCQVLAVKMHDGSCNHMTCAVCGVEFCWLCMKEISDLHYLSPSGCTFWGKKPWSRKKKLLWQLGTLIGAPVGIALLAGISIPAMLIGIPSWVGRKIFDHYKDANKHKRNLAVAGGVICSIVLSPFLAGLAVSIGVPILLCYVYGVVPIALCRSEGCGVTTSSSGVKIDIDEDPPYRPSIPETLFNSNNVANPSIGEVSLGASMSMGSGCILENAGDTVSNRLAEPDRESASNTAVAGASLTGSVTSSYVGLMKRNHRLEVGVDVHPRKKFSFSSERLSETVSLSERSATVSLADDGNNSVAASTRALAGSLLAYRFGDSQSMHSYRAAEAADNQSMAGMTQQLEDEVSLRSLPMTQHGHHISYPTRDHQSNFHSSHGVASGGGSHLSSNLNPMPRSMSPVSSMSGDELSHGGRRSQRRRPLLDKQLSENSSLLSAEDAVSERVRFDDNISFIDDPTNSAVLVEDQVMNAAGGGDNTSLNGRILNKNKMEPSILTEETAEELAEVISPELTPRMSIMNVKSSMIDNAGSSILSQGTSGVTLLSIGGLPKEDEEASEAQDVDDEEKKLKESFSAKL